MNQQESWAWWHTPAIPAIGEADAGASHIGDQYKPFRETLKIRGGGLLEIQLSIWAGYLAQGHKHLPASAKSLSLIIGKEKKKKHSSVCSEFLPG